MGGAGGTAITRFSFGYDVLAEVAFVRCSNCGRCCEETQMELSGRDIERLENEGYHPEEFALMDNDAIQLRNVGGWCYFYNVAEKKCQVYEKRPLGCYLYPVVYLVNEGAVVDELCPMGKTISERELRTKAKILVKLLKEIDVEREDKAHF